MKQRLYWFSVLAAFLVALALSVPALAAGQSVPFKGRSSGTVTPVGFDQAAGILYAHVEGQGQATHLGRFTQTGDAAVDVATGNAGGTWMLTAANGDQLFLDFEAIPTSDSTHGLAAFTIVGGTGRFQGATGSYTQTIVFTTTPGTPGSTFTDVLEGTISFGHQ
jgi:hypothetical protein